MDFKINIDSKAIIDKATKEAQAHIANDTSSIIRAFFFEGGGYSNLPKGEGYKIIEDIIEKNILSDTTEKFIERHIAERWETILKETIELALTHKAKKATYIKLAKSVPKQEDQK